MGTTSRRAWLYSAIAILVIWAAAGIPGLLVR